MAGTSNHQTTGPWQTTGTLQEAAGASESRCARRCLGPRRPDSVGKLQNAGGSPTYLEAIVCRQQQQAGWLIVGMVVREREREKTFPREPCKGLCRSQGKGSESRLGLPNYIIHRIWLTIIWPQRRGREWATAGYPLSERGLVRALRASALCCNRDAQSTGRAAPSNDSI